VLDARSTIDSLNDIAGLNYAWDTDINFDSNGDGIKDNDADLVGPRVEHVFKQEGKVTVKAMVWDENPEKPGSKQLIITVGPADRTILQDAGALLAGEEANPIAQLALALIVILSLVLISRRRGNAAKAKTWERDELDDAFDSDGKLNSANRKPTSAPPGFVFDQALQMPPRSLSPLMYQSMNYSLTPQFRPQAYPTGGQWNNGSITGTNG